MRALLGVVVLLAATSTVGAACFEDIGCTDSDRFSKRDLRRLSCENLYVARNSIYDEHGLCFRTEKAQSYFDNGDCYVDDPEDIELSRIEEANVASIKSVERQKGCR